MAWLRRLSSRPFQDWCALAGVACRLLGTRVALALLPYRAVQRLYARPLRRLSPTVDVAAYRRRVAWAVRVIGPKVLGERPCLAQALVADRMLRRSGATTALEIGVNKGADGRLLAHAWVECDGVVVVGRSSSPLRYEPLRRVSVTPSEPVRSPDEPTPPAPEAAMTRGPGANELQRAGVTPAFPLLDAKEPYPGGPAGHRLLRGDQALPYATSASL